MTLNHAEVNRLKDIRDHINLIDIEMNEILNNGMDAPLVLVLEARMLAREASEIRLFADGRKHHEIGNEARAELCYEKAIMKQAAKNELRQIIEFLNDERTHVSLPPHMTDEDDEYFL